MKLTDLMTDNSSHLITIDYNSIQFDNGYLSSKNSRSVFSYGSKLDAQDMNIIMQRSYNGSWIPVQVIVNGKQGRRIGCVVADDRMRYSVFDLDHPEEDEEHEYTSDADMDLMEEFEE